MSTRAYGSENVATLSPSQIHAIQAYRSYIAAQIRKFPGSQFYLSRLDQYIRQAAISDPNQILIFEFAGSRSDNDPEPFPWEPVGVTAQQLHSRIVVSDGFPSPTTVVQLGQRYHVRPEVFLGHLAFERVLSRDRTSFELPALPSQRGNVVHVCLMRLGRAVEEMDSDKSIANVQAEMDRSSQYYERKLFDGSKYRATRFRKVTIHNRRYFSVEQDVTFCVSKNLTNLWTGIFLLDRGNGLRPDDDLPWKCFTSQNDQLASFLPIPNYNQDIDSVAPMANIESIDSSNVHGISTYHPLKDMLSELDIILSAQSPFFLLCRLYRTALWSYVQISNFLDEDTLRCQRTFIQDSSEVIELLRSRIDFTDSMVTHLHSCRETIERWDSGDWAELQPDSSVPRLNEIRETLLQDVQHLLDRSHDISHRCERTVSLLLSSTSVVEAQKSIRQAESVERLSQLAFYFIPVSLAASIFGMNVHEINSSSVRIWVFVVLSAGLTCLAVTYTRLESIKYFLSGIFERSKRK